MKLRVLASLTVALLALPLAAAAEDPPGSKKGGTPLEFKQSEIPMAKGRRPVVRPVPPPALAVQDAERAVAEFEARQREEALIRDVTRLSPRRPDRDYDITSGIQQREVLKARGR